MVENVSLDKRNCKFPFPFDLLMSLYFHDIHVGASQRVMFPIER